MSEMCWYSFVFFYCGTRCRTHFAPLGDALRPSDLEEGEKYSVREPGDIAVTVEKKSAKALGMGASWKETYAACRGMQLPLSLPFYT